MDKQYKVNKISDDTIEITLNIPKESFSKSYETLLKDEIKKSNVKGFRKGQAPREMIEEQLKPALLFNTLEKLAPMYVNRAITEEKLEIVAPPQFKDLPKLDTGKDIPITVLLTIMPEFKLGDMRKVKVKAEKISVTEKEIEEIISKLEENKSIKAKKGTNKWAIEVSKYLQIEDVKDIDSLKEKIKEILISEKEKIVKKNVENEALDKAIEICKIKIPQPAVDLEAHEREHSFMHNLENSKMTLDQYTQSQGVTIEQMREHWGVDAKKALETDVFLKLFAKEKDIAVSKEDLESEVEKLKKSNPSQNELYDNPQWQNYIKAVLLKQKSFEKFLELVGLKKK